MGVNERLGNVAEQEYIHRQNQQARYEADHPVYDSEPQGRDRSYDQYDIEVCKRNIKCVSTNISGWEAEISKHKNSPSGHRVEMKNGEVISAKAYMKYCRKKIKENRKLDAEARTYLRKLVGFIRYSFMKL